MQFATLRAYIVLFVAAAFSSAAHAQKDPVFADLADKGHARWSAEHKAWLATDRTASIKIATPELSISEKFYAMGREVIIAAETLEFKESGQIATGFPSAAGGEGAAGPRGGNVTVFARKILSLRLATAGQDGGDGAAGSRGSPGYDGSSGGDGSDAVCRGGYPTGAGGSDGSPGSGAGDGGKGGRGSDGGKGGDGGAAGNVTLFYAASQIDLTTAGAGIDIRGGEGGEGGKGGDGGSGGYPGANGANGRDADCNCYCEDKPCPGRRCLLNSRCQKCNYSGGSGGSGGSYGSDGDRGRQGATGADGASGKYAQTKLPDGIVLERLAQHLPELGQQKVDQAELLFAANRPTEAAAVLTDAVRLARDTPSKARANLLLHRIGCGRNYYNTPYNWARPYFTTEIGREQVPQSLEWVEKELEKLQDIVRQSEDVLRYREDRIYKAQDAQNAYVAQLGELSRKIDSNENSIKNFGNRIKLLSDQIEQFSGHAERLKTRMADLKSELRSIPEAIGHVEQIVGATGEAVTNLTLSITLLASQNYAAGLLALGKAFAAVGKVKQSVTELRLAVKDLILRVKNQIADATDDLFALQVRIQDSSHELDKARSDREFSSEQQIRLREMQSDLERFKAAQDLEGLTRLRDLARKIYREHRLGVGGIIDEYRRYIDLVMREREAVRSLGPPNGLDRLFDTAHISDLRIKEKNRVLRYSGNPPSFQEVLIAFDRSEVLTETKYFFDDLQQGLHHYSMLVPPSVVDEKYSFLRDARIVKIGARMSNKAGTQLDYRYTIKHGGTTTSVGDAGSMDYNLPYRELSQQSQSTYLFAYRTLNDLWGLKLQALPTTDIDKISFAILFEIPSSRGAVGAVEETSAVVADPVVSNFWSMPQRRSSFNVEQNIAECNALFAAALSAK